VDFFFFFFSCFPFPWFFLYRLSSVRKTSPLGGLLNQQAHVLRSKFFFCVLKVFLFRELPLTQRSFSFLTDFGNLDTVFGAPFSLHFFYALPLLSRGSLSLPCFLTRQEALYISFYHQRPFHPPSSPLIF